MNADPVELIIFCLALTGLGVCFFCRYWKETCPEACAPVCERCGEVAEDFYGVTLCMECETKEVGSYTSLQSAAVHFAEVHRTGTDEQLAQATTLLELAAMDHAQQFLTQGQTPNQPYNKKKGKAA